MSFPNEQFNEIMSDISHGLTVEQKNYLGSEITHRRVSSSKLALTLGLGRSGLKKYSRYVRNGGILHGCCGRPRLLDEGALSRLVTFVAGRPDIENKEILIKIREEYGRIVGSSSEHGDLCLVLIKSISRATMWRYVEIIKRRALNHEIE